MKTTNLRTSVPAVLVLIALDGSNDVPIQVNRHGLVDFMQRLTSIDA